MRSRSRWELVRHSGRTSTYAYVPAGFRITAPGSPGVGGPFTLLICANLLPFARSRLKVSSITAVACVSCVVPWVGTTTKPL